MLAGGVLAVLIGALWMPRCRKRWPWFATSGWLMGGHGAAGCGLLPAPAGQRSTQGVWGYAPFGIGAVGLIVVAAAREALRFVTLLGTHGYDALDYKINMDWYSTSLFFITFAVWAA
jgi:hypothetical protein